MRICSTTFVLATLAVLTGCHRLDPSLPVPHALRPVLEITGPAWKLVEIAGTPVAEGSKASLDFLDTGKPDSRVSGNASCNKFSGKAKIAGTSIQFGPLISTKMACAAASLNAQEMEYLRALQNAERWEMKDHTLAIYSKGSEKPLRFVQ